MTIDAECRYLTDAGKWSAPFAGNAGLTSTDSKHAERVAYEAAKAKSSALIFKIVQNAFPCKKCTVFFLNQSVMGKLFIFDCTENDGLYARECGFLSKPFKPDPDHPGMKEAELKGFVYFKSGMLYAKNKIITVSGLSPTDVQIETAYAVGDKDDCRPKELIKLEGASQPQGR
jgi:hypothetical protein